MDNSLSESYTRRDFLKTIFRLCGMCGAFLICPRFLTAMSSQETKGQPAAKEAVASDSKPDFEPAYLKLHRSGELRRRAEELREIMRNCRLCPRKCGVNRLEGREGFCRAPGDTLIVATAQAHFGEEKPLVGTGGSGTIFLTHCNMRCVFCQNYRISQLGRGEKTTVNELASMMLQLQKRGCHNINIVTPTHYSPHILAAVDAAAGKGLRLPIVYNTSGWERLEILEFLDGVVDIYLPDFKYWESAMADKYSAGAESYPRVTKEAVLEMNRQVGVAEPSKRGIMERGLMIRHLVMPNKVSGSQAVMEWIAENLPKDTYVNIMAQYTPMHKAYDYPEISRRINREEYEQVVKKAREAGLSNLDVRGFKWF
ncbi:MAG: radical SAM protein [Spirochaetia bacterium]